MEQIISIQRGGNGQTWQDVTTSRSRNTVYTNSTAAPITVYIIATVSGGTTPYVTVNGTLLFYGATEASADYISPVSVLIPSGSTYNFNGGSVSSYTWYELR